MLKRLKFRCWNCLREYSMTRELDGKPSILVACPFCDTEAVADLEPYRDTTTLIYQRQDAPPSPGVPTYSFPPVIPTSAPPAAEQP